MVGSSHKLCETSRWSLLHIVHTPTRASTHVMMSVKNCARASYVEIYWFLSISTTDVTTCLATDAFCALVWPQSKPVTKVSW
jgi:hypothetical protein